ncbi:FAD/NAD(P)-binding protein [Actinotalea sp. Marseille-Q4924]|uniref:FAD/NAD(P)-binding protein n=1 Tax=Actinotalea sp. Marseille-Q4924 TaxID=2866571 RepID=UPI001CE41C94|nr:FAD/NAD(P)-binding protein [Actinotalea sp. Marseille-Q4924]
MTSLVERRRPTPPAPTDPMRPVPYRLEHLRQETRDTYTLELAPVDGEPLRYGAGQFTMLDAFGVGEVPISISGDPTRAGLLEHTIRDVGAVTHALVSASPGDVLGVRGPFGTTWDVTDGQGGDVVLVAGGIGLAPVRPALLELLTHRERYNRVVLLYGARTPEDILFGEDLRSWAKDFGVDVDITVDNGQHAWRGKVGLVTQLVPRAGFDARHTLALVCGPEGMMRYVAQALVDRGVPPYRVRLSMERSMKCGIGLCGHCQLRELFVCVDGPVLTYDRLAPLLTCREL